MKPIFKVITLVTMLMVFLSGCSWMGNSVNLVVDKQHMDTLTVMDLSTSESSSTRGFGFGYRLMWRCSIWANTKYTIVRRFDNDSETDITLTGAIVDIDGYHVYSDEEEEDFAGCNAIVTYYVTAHYPDDTTKTSIASFMILPNTGTVKVTALSSEAYNPVDIYNTTGMEWDLLWDNEAAILEEDAVFTDMKDMNNWDAGIDVDTGPLYPGRTFNLAMYVNVDGWAADKYLVEQPGYFQHSNSANCLIEAVPAEDLNTGTAYAWTYRFEDIPLHLETCDEDYNDAVLLVELLNYNP